jgi:hypothetical protein
MQHKTQWHVVQNVKTGRYEVTRYVPGHSEDDAEFLPRSFINGEIAEIAADKANNPWKYAR